MDSSNPMKWEKQPKLPFENQQSQQTKEEKKSTKILAVSLRLRIFEEDSMFPDKEIKR